MKLKKLRQARGFSQHDMADHMNRSQSAYSRIESGASRLYEDELLALCRILECKAEDLLETTCLLACEEHVAPSSPYIGTTHELIDRSHDFLEKMQQRSEVFLERLTQQFLQALQEGRRSKKE